MLHRAHHPPPGVGLSLSNARPARRPGGPAPSCLGTLSPGRLPLLPAVTVSQLSSLLCNSPRAPQAPLTKPAGSPSSSVTWVPWVPLLSSSVQMPISSKTTVSCQVPAILRPSGPCVRRETGCFPGRTVCLVFLLSLGDSPSSQTSPSPGKAFSLISLSFLCLPWYLSRTTRGVPVLGPAVGCWKCLLGILS